MLNVKTLLYGYNHNNNHFETQDDAIIVWRSWPEFLWELHIYT